MALRNTKAFKEAVAQTSAELAQRGVPLAPAMVGDTIVRNVSTVAELLCIQARSAWRYFDAAALADNLATSARTFEQSNADSGVGSAPMPSFDNPELALVLASTRMPSP
ncbi:hypothetical protein [Streptomyces sp. Ru62]|uniref:hypothetical protein n=1 Tax=Streptomyces sp. Ru62 TaxID=2080745 RepID=UPI002156581A|nr:hypothetical protein [Streptomyces sp. Ru62]